jgi:hypothetical protein
VQTSPFDDISQRSTGWEALLQVEYAVPSFGVTRTRERQFARALVLASHSSDDGSPRAVIAVSAQMSAATAVAESHTLKLATVRTAAMLALKHEAPIRLVP